jgi:hypothetical protein
MFVEDNNIFNLIKKVLRFLSGGLNFFVSAGVHTPAEMPRSGNKVNKQVAKRIANFRFDPYQKSPPLLKRHDKIRHKFPV